jgi:hypothetical protein
MGKPANLAEKPKRKSEPARWPFDPMSDPLQPGDHEPVRMPEAAEQVRKQAGARARNRTPKGGRR